MRLSDNIFDAQGAYQRIKSRSELSITNQRSEDGLLTLLILLRFKPVQLLAVCKPLLTFANQVSSVTRSVPGLADISRGSHEHKTPTGGKVSDISSISTAPLEYIELPEPYNRLKQEHQEFPFGIQWWLTRINDASSMARLEKIFLLFQKHYGGYDEYIEAAQYYKKKRTNFFLLRGGGGSNL